MTKATPHFYIAYWDSLGFESIIDLTDHDKQAMWAELKGEKPKRLQAVPYLIMRAKANPQRFPEIWTFQSVVDISTLIKYSNDTPQELADLIREHGTKVFVTHREKEVIR
jgi:hypothetical protein